MYVIRIIRKNVKMGFLKTFQFLCIKEMYHRLADKVVKDQRRGDKLFLEAVQLKGLTFDGGLNLGNNRWRLWL